ncbi:hypothetical protein B0T18DRAFT_391809 [Schizothecium vesticola]|uniref:N-acetyltransferase domain-containing protein n=1 Tax=Schizothecium vesticola TaxID=314040 RepID=A0AA40EP70_9PEZI|nr:hypothetical protein B0T18DRAFT_391809 [Schizothecium vesticola]
MASSAANKILDLEPVDLHDTLQFAELQRQRVLCGWSHSTSVIESWRADNDDKTQAMFWVVPVSLSEIPAPRRYAGHIAMSKKTYDENDVDDVLPELKVMDLGTLFILPEHRGRGLARAAVRMLEGMAKDKPYGWAGCKVMTLNTLARRLLGEELPAKGRSNEDWYNRMGYVKWKEAPLYPAWNEDGSEFKFDASFMWKVDDTIAVDENVAGLCDEIKALGRVLESISSASTSAPRPVLAEIDPDGSLWAVVIATLGGIDNTLAKLSQLPKEVKKSDGAFSRGFLRKPTKQIKFGFRSKDIATCKDRVQSYNTAMTSALQMINVCLMIHNNSSQDAVFNVLDGLKSQIGRVEIALHQGTQSNFGLTGSSQNADGNQITRNLRQLVRVAESFHSHVSTITKEGRSSTVWGGSVLGDTLTRERFSSGITTPSTVVDPSHHPDSDDDIDEALLKRLRELAVESRQQGDYARAENFYRKVINRSESSESNYNPQDLAQDRIDLAYACLRQRKWADAETIILPIAMERTLADIAVFVGLHTLALAHMHSSEFAKADQCCKRALWGKRKTLEENPPCWETLALLSRICEARGETEEAEAHRTFIPAS